MTRCDLCDFIGPAESGFQGDLLELHRAMHQLGRTLIDPLVPVVDRVNRALTRT